MVPLKASPVATAFSKNPSLSRTFFSSIGMCRISSEKTASYKNLLFFAKKQSMKQSFIETLDGLDKLGITKKPLAGQSKRRKDMSAGSSPFRQSSGRGTRPRAAKCLQLCPRQNGGTRSTGSQFLPRLARSEPGSGWTREPNPESGFRPVPAPPRVLLRSKGNLCPGYNLKTVIGQPFLVRLCLMSSTSSWVLVVFPGLPATVSTQNLRNRRGISRF